MAAPPSTASIDLLISVVELSQDHTVAHAARLDGDIHLVRSDLPQFELEACSEGYFPSPGGSIRGSCMSTDRLVEYSHEAKDP